ncbi:MAG: hypothetical protein ACYC0V_04760 [Armatimonadota bacterium]
MTTIIGFIMLFVMFCFAAGWIGFLIWGIVSLKKKQKTLGVVLISVGGAWALVVTGAILLVISTINSGYDNQTPFNPATYKGAMGSIVTRYKGDSMLVVKDTNTNKRMSVKSSDGVFRVPAGSLEIVRYQFGSSDENGLTADCRLGYSKPVIHTIKPNSETPLDIGTPITASIDVKKNKTKSVDLTLHVTDSTRHNYSLNSVTDKLDFVVVNMSGKKLWEGVLESG